jgi:hypothetical protein
MPCMAKKIANHNRLRRRYKYGSLQDLPPAGIVLYLVLLTGTGTNTVLRRTVRITALYKY